MQVVAHRAAHRLGQRQLLNAEWRQRGSETEAVPWFAGAVVGPDRLDGYVELFAIPLDHQICRLIAGFIENRDDGVHPVNRLAIHRHNAIASSKAGLNSGIPRRDVLDDQRTVLLPGEQTQGFDFKVLALGRVGEQKLGAELFGLSVYGALHRDGDGAVGIQRSAFVQPFPGWILRVIEADDAVAGLETRAAGGRIRRHHVENSR